MGGQEETGSRPQVARTAENVEIGASRFTDPVGRGGCFILMAADILSEAERGGEVKEVESSSGWGRSWMQEEGMKTVISEKRKMNLLRETAGPVVLVECQAKDRGQEF